MNEWMNEKMDGFDIISHLPCVYACMHVSALLIWKASQCWSGIRDRSVMLCYALSSTCDLNLEG